MSVSFLNCRQTPFHCIRERQREGERDRELHHGDSTLTTSSKPNCLLRFHPNTITLEVSASTYEFERDTFKFGWLASGVFIFWCQVLYHLTGASRALKASWLSPPQLSPLVVIIHLFVWFYFIFYSCLHVGKHHAFLSCFVIATLSSSLAQCLAHNMHVYVFLDWINEFIRVHCTHSQWTELAGRVITQGFIYGEEGKSIVIKWRWVGARKGSHRCWDSESFSLLPKVTLGLGAFGLGLSRGVHRGSQ